MPVDRRRLLRLHRLAGRGAGVCPRRRRGQRATGGPPGGDAAGVAGRAGVRECRPSRDRDSRQHRPGSPGNPGPVRHVVLRRVVSGWPVDILQRRPQPTDARVRQCRRTAPGDRRDGHRFVRWRPVRGKDGRAQTGRLPGGVHRRRVRSARPERQGVRRRSTAGQHCRDARD